jgi:hypothetical protein
VVPLDAEIEFLSEVLAHGAEVRPRAPALTCFGLAEQRGSIRRASRAGRRAAYASPVSSSLL